jgi:hypothetical protein
MDGIQDCRLILFILLICQGLRWFQLVPPRPRPDVAPGGGGPKPPWRPPPWPPGTVEPRRGELGAGCSPDFLVGHPAPPPCWPWFPIGCPFRQPASAEHGVRQ